jgi:hypothetical protein
MPAKRTGFDLSVERELPGTEGEPPIRARLSAHFELGPGDPPPTPEELEAALRELRTSLATAAGPAGPPRPDRALPELIETYRPRQSELVDLLRDEGQLSPVEHRLLTEHLAGKVAPGSAAAAPAPPVPAPTPHPPLAGAPAEVERPAGAPTRPVPELLEQYRITSLRQAGAVRARRQISFEEYMAIKRHFSTIPAPTGGGPPPASG